MAINKFHWLRLTFNLLAKMLILESHQYLIVISETDRPIELNFHMKTPYNKLAKIIQILSFHDQDCRHAHIWKKTFNNLLQNQKADNHGN